MTAVGVGDGVGEGVGDGVGEGDADSTAMFVRVDTEVALEVLMVNHLIDLPLTPLRRRIALFAMLGNRRTDCAGYFGVSEEAMKKHLRTVFEVTATANWAGMVANHAKAVIWRAAKPPRTRKSVLPQICPRRPDATASPPTRTPLARHTRR